MIKTLYQRWRKVSFARSVGLRSAGPSGMRHHGVNRTSRMGCPPRRHRISCFGQVVHGSSAGVPRDDTGVSCGPEAWAKVTPAEEPNRRRQDGCYGIIGVVPLGTLGDGDRDRGSSTHPQSFVVEQLGTVEVSALSQVPQRLSNSHFGVLMESLSAKCALRAKKVGIQLEK